MSKQEIAEKYFENFYNVNNPTEAAALADELVSANFVDHSPAFGATPDKNGFKQTVGFINSTFEQQFKVEQLIIENDLYVGIWKATVKHIGELMGVAPTGKQFEVNGITVYRIANDKITEHWEQFEIAKIMQTLGVI